MFVRSLPNVELQHSLREVETIDVFQSSNIPPINHLLVWQQELSAAERISSNFFFMKTDYGNISLKEVKHYISLHTVQTIKTAVGQEIDWFNEGYLTPVSISCLPSPAALNCFRSMILNRPASEFVEDLQMTPNELAMLCGKRYLSGDHVTWITKQLNKQNTNTMCFYLNRVHNIKETIERTKNKANFKQPDNISFIINVGRGHDGHTYLGSDSNPGNHRTAAFYKRSNNTLVYGDSLGWVIPNRLEEKIGSFVSCIWGTDTTTTTTKYGHDPGYHCLLYTSPSPRDS